MRVGPRASNKPMWRSRGRRAGTRNWWIMSRRRRSNVGARIGSRTRTGRKKGRVTGRIITSRGIRSISRIRMRSQMRRKVVKMIMKVRVVGIRGIGSRYRDRSNTNRERSKWKMKAKRDSKMMTSKWRNKITRK